MCVCVCVCVPHKLSFPEGTTSLHIEYKVACMCRCSMQCLLSVFINYFLDFINSCRYTENSHTEETIYIYIYMKIVCA